MQRCEELMKMNILKDQWRSRVRRDERAMGVVTRGVSLSAITASSRQRSNQHFEIKSGQHRVVRNASRAATEATLRSQTARR